MTEAQEIVFLKKKLEDQRIQYYRVFDELKRVKEELSSIKRMASGSPKNWYTSYLQKALSGIERQYEDLQENFHQLSAKYSHEMAKRQYIFPNSHVTTSKAEDPYDHTEFEQI